jgi:hypothetical protein
MLLYQNVDFYFQKEKKKCRLITIIELNNDRIYHYKC